MITLAQFRDIEAAVRAAGYGKTIAWSETPDPPKTARKFAREAIFVICSSGMRNTVAQIIFDRCVGALRIGASVRTVFGHPGKAAAIDYIWAERKRLYSEYRMAVDAVEYLATLPWVGPITKFHLAKNFGGDFAKPDVHLNRLADAENVTAQELCERLGMESGYRAATIDLILWRACADGIIDSKSYAPFAADEPEPPD